MAKIYTGPDAEDFIFDESATYEGCRSTKEGCKKEEDCGTEYDDEVNEAVEEEMRSCGVIECVDDPEVACYRIALENEQNYNMIMNAFMMQEVAALESTGEELVYEAGKVKSFFSAVQEAINRFWQKIQGVFKNVMNKITASVAANKKFINKYKNEKLLKPTKEAKFKGYNFPGYTPMFHRVPIELNKAIDTSKLSTITKDNVDNATEAFKNNFDNIKDKIRGAMCGKSTTITEDNYKDELKLSFYGSKEKVDVELIEFSKLIEQLDSAKNISNMLRDMYKNSQKAVSEIKKGIKKAEKDVEKNDNKNAAMKYAKCFTDAVNASLPIMSMAFSAKISSLTSRMIQYKAMASFYISNQPKKDDKTSSNNESAFEQELGITLI